MDGPRGDFDEGRDMPFISRKTGRQSHQLFHLGIIFVFQQGRMRVRYPGHIAARREGHRFARPAESTLLLGAWDVRIVTNEAQRLPHRS